MNKTNQSTSLVRNTEGKLPSKVADDVVGTQGDDSLKEQVEKILGDFKYHELNECATMDVPSLIPCDHTGCGGSRCKQELERVKHCNCGGDERYQADIKNILALFQSERTKAKEEVLRVALAQQRQDLKEQVMEAIGKDEKEGKHARCAYKFTGMEWYCDDHEIRDFPNEFNGDSVTRNKLRAEQRKRIEAIFEMGGELIIKNESK